MLDPGLLEQQNSLTYSLTHSTIHVPGPFPHFSCYPQTLMPGRQLAHEGKSQRLSHLNRRETTMIPGIPQVKEKMGLSLGGCGLLGGKGKEKQDLGSSFAKE